MKLLRKCEMCFKDYVTYNESFKRFCCIGCEANWRALPDDEFDKKQKEYKEIIRNKSQDS